MTADSSALMMSWAGAWRSGRRKNRCWLGDVLDLAFTVDYNEHPEFGGVQLNLLDFAHRGNCGQRGCSGKPDFSSAN